MEDLPKGFPKELPEDIHLGITTGIAGNSSRNLDIELQQDLFLKTPQEFYLWIHTGIPSRITSWYSCFAFHQEFLGIPIG